MNRVHSWLPGSDHFSVSTFLQQHRWRAIVAIAIAAAALAVGSNSQAANIAAPGVGIIGLKTNVDDTMGRLLYHTGVQTNIIDNNLTTKVDTFSGADAEPTAFVGVIWPGKHYETITNITLTLATFGDGGWFGVPGALAPTGGALAATNLIEPVVQVTTNLGTNWVTVASTSDYQVVMLGHQVGGTGGQPNPSSRTSMFTLATPATKINGIRITGTNGGRAGGDTNGFLGVFEFVVNADPIVDADADGMADNFESEYVIDDPNDDADFDGLTNLDEYQRYLNPQAFDTDGDGLGDSDEITTYLTDPTRRDTDGDGLTDGAEINVHLTNPLLTDTDGDTLSDGAEVNTYVTNPRLADSDGDLFRDNVEITFGTNPNNASNYPENFAAIGQGIVGVRATVDSGVDEPYSQQGLTAAVLARINDNNVGTRLDTYNGAGLQSASYVGIVWSNIISAPLQRIQLTMALYGDGGWFGSNTISPGAGLPLASNHLFEPYVEVSTNSGTNWVRVSATSDYFSYMVGKRIGNGGQLNPTNHTVNFTLNSPATNISGIRLIGTEGGTASRGFLGVSEFRAMVAVSDTDNDGMNDSWENMNGLVVGINDSSLDPDSDGLSNLQEFQRNTNPQVVDTDGDGLTDGAEVNTYLTNPTLSDTDGDGLSDGAEANTHTTNPLVRDTDGDGFADGQEVALGTSPTNPASFPSNMALSATGLLGVKDNLDGTAGRLVYNAGTAANINDNNLATVVDSYTGGTETYSFVGLLWNNPPPVPVSTLQFTMATFFDGGWFGPNGSGPGSGGVLGTNYLIEPIIQVSTNRGTNWFAVPYASDYLVAVSNHPLPAVDFGAPTPVTTTFILVTPMTNITGIRIIGKEGGTASGGFLGAFELKSPNQVIDSDADGMNDMWETWNGLTVGVNDGGGDIDGDGLSNLLEFQNGSNPKVVDSDGDGLSDGAEVLTHHTSPRRADTDDDGLSDSAEVNTYSTNPNLSDTDGDQFADGLEVARGTNPNTVLSHPTNYAIIATGLLGVTPNINSSGILVYNSGVAAAITDENLTTRVDGWRDTGETNSFVGLRWNSPLTSPIATLRFTLATFFDGGWFGPNDIGPGSGGVLSAMYLLEPSVQVSTNGGTTWTTVAATSDYLTVMTNHTLPAVDFGPPTAVTATFQLTTPQANINAIRIVGSEGGQSGHGFLGVFELTAVGPDPLAVRLVDWRFTGGQFSFGFVSVIGATHTVEYKAALSDPTWEPLITFPGDGTMKRFTNTLGGMLIHRVTSQ